MDRGMQKLVGGCIMLAGEHAVQQRPGGLQPPLSWSDCSCRCSIVDAVFPIKYLTEVQFLRTGIASLNVQSLQPAPLLLSLLPPPLLLLLLEGLEGGMVPLACWTKLALSTTFVVSAHRLTRPQRQPPGIEPHCKLGRVVESTGLPKATVPSFREEVAHRQAGTGGKDFHECSIPVDSYC